jgi:HK97 family phage major capsid protein
MYTRNEQIKSMPLTALDTFIEAKFKEGTKMYAEANNGANFNEDQLKEFQDRNAELTEARVRAAELKATDDAYQKNLEFYRQQYGGINRPPAHTGTENQPTTEGKSLGDLFTESKAYTERRGDIKLNPIEANLDGISLKSLEELKTTLTTTAGFAPFSPRTPRVVDLAQRRPVVADLIPQTSTTSPLIIWMEETTFTNTAAPVAEGGQKPEATLAYTQRSQAVQKIAVTIPVTDEQLADVPQMRSLIDNRLTLMLLLTEENQLLNGDGVAPNLLGFLEKPGTGSTVRAGGEDNTDAILRAIYEVNATEGFANTSGIVMNPLNMLAIRLLRTTTGEYIWGHPSDNGPMTLWGLPVVETTAMTANTALVGDFKMFSHVSRRMGIRIDVGYINEDFRNNILRIRAEERLSLEIYRAAAFNEVTSLNQAA